MDNYLALVEERRRAYRVYMGKSEGKTLLGRPIRIREDNVKTYLKNWLERCRLDCCDSKDGEVAGCCECCNEHSGSINEANFLTR